MSVNVFEMKINRLKMFSNVFQTTISGKSNGFRPLSSYY